MTQIIVRGQTIQWNGPGLPTEAFRIAIRMGTAEYRPEPINGQNRQTRQQVLMMLTGGTSSLRASLLNLMRLTASRGGLEHAAFIFRNGTLGPVNVGTIGGVDGTVRPVGDVVGFVHTHPVPPGVLAPPSAGDFDEDFGPTPIQLVVEMGGRVWELFEGRYSSLLGTINALGHFFPVNAPSNGFVYRVVDMSTVGMEAHDRARAQYQAGQDRAAAAMRQLAEQRRLEAERRSRGPR